MGLEAQGHAARNRTSPNSGQRGAQMNAGPSKQQGVAWRVTGRREAGAPGQKLTQRCSKTPTGPRPREGWGREGEGRGGHFHELSP